MRPFNYLLPVAALLLGSLASIASGPQKSVPSAPALSPDSSLMGRLEERPELRPAADLFALAGLSGRLRGKRPYTLLVPTAKALSDDQGLVDELVRTSSRKRLSRIMRYHVLRGRHRYLWGLTEMDTLASQPVSISVYRSKGWADDSRLGERIRARNGYIFTVDQVLIPRGDPAR